jgi:hypothetical protein
MNAMKMMPRPGAAEHHHPHARHGAVASLFRLFDGSLNWHPISTAPFNHDVEVRVAGDHGSRVIPFPCRQTTSGWINADLDVRIDMDPTAWRAWPEDRD